MSDEQPTALDHLAAAAQTRQAMSGSRRWASRKRQKVEAYRIQITDAVINKGLSQREVRELLAAHFGLTVGRWMMEDVMRHIRASAKRRS